MRAILNIGVTVMWLLLLVAAIKADLGSGRVIGIGLMFTGSLILSVAYWKGTA